MSRKRVAGDTSTIYEEDRGSLSSADEGEDRLGSLHGNRFGSCRELTSVGLEKEEDQRLRPLSSTKHKRPSLPSFTKLPAGSEEPQSLSSSLPRDAAPQNSTEGSPGPSPPSSPSRGEVLRRKLSDPGSAPSTPAAGNSPTNERRQANRAEGGGRGGLSRANRPRRKGFTFSVGGSNLSPDWVSLWSSYGLAIQVRGSRFGEHKFAYSPACYTPCSVCGVGNSSCLLTSSTCVCSIQ